MEKTELVEFLKEEYQRIEDVLYSMGEIKEFVQDKESLNNYIQDQFSDALMYLESGKLNELEVFLKRKREEQWIYSKSF